MALYPASPHVDRIVLSESLNESGHDMEGGFDLIVETDTSYEGIKVSMYRSSKTGLKVLVADVDTPIVPALHVVPLT